MKKYLVVIMLLTITGIKAQKKPAVEKKPAEKTLPALKDTSFDNLGVKFGYPEGYAVMPVSSSASTMVFRNNDSSIFISVRTTGATFQTVSNGWSSEEKKGAKDHWFKHVGRTPHAHVFSTKPLYVSDYAYPYNCDGADFFWISVLATKPGIGLDEMEAVKRSLSITKAPQETREIIPGIATMEIPVYYQPEKSAKLSAFKANSRLLEFFKSDVKGDNSSIMASEDLKRTGLMNGFTVRGNIKFRSPSGVTFTGFYGRLVRKTGNYNEAHVFFDYPAGTTHQCYGARLRLLKGYSLNLGKDLEAMLATIKFL
jgi:hypothetical protein